jgi:hypothetical protein
MPDQQFERRLRAALRESADMLPFTITPAELERRIALRGRNPFEARRFTLLAAAAVAVGLVAIGSLIGGSIQQRPVPTAPIAAVPSPVASAVTRLPSLDDFLAAGTGTVLVAQAHDPIDPQSSGWQSLKGTQGDVELGQMWARGEYRVAIACLGDTSLEYDLRNDPGQGPGTVVPCTGSLVERTLSLASPAHVVLRYTEPTSWRVIVRGDLAALPLPSENPVIPPADAAFQELVRSDDQTMDAGEPWGNSGLLIREVMPVPGRFGYAARLWCPFGDSVRLVFGSPIENGPLVAETETEIACNDLIHDLDLRMPEPAGSQVFVAAAPGTRWSLLVTSEMPPITLGDDVPGWQMEAGFGPDFAFEEQGVSLSGAGDGVVKVQAVLACTGTKPIEVTVEDGTPIGTHGQVFTATCTPGGSINRQIFTVSPSGVNVSFTAPQGTWTALSLLVPK